MSEKESQNIEQKGAKTQQIIVFRLGGEEYGLSIEQIKEVVITPRITRVPLTPSYIKGVANIRGNILTIIDLEEKFGIALANATPITAEQNYSLVVESKDLLMAILVREVPNTLAVSEEQIEYSPNVINEASVQKNYIKGIIKQANRLIILIDIFKVIDRQDIQQMNIKS